MRRWLSFLALLLATVAFGYESELRTAPRDFGMLGFYHSYADAEAKPIPYRYNPFGNLISRTCNTPNNYLYCGEQLDPNLSLYFLRARYLNPDTGRFWTMDSYECFVPDPASLHKYTYCTSDPINATDPTGLFTLH